MIGSENILASLTSVNYFKATLVQLALTQLIKLIQSIQLIHSYLNLLRQIIQIDKFYFI